MQYMGVRGRDNEAIFNCPRLCNKHLREWAQSAGIAKHITFHSGRHTFAVMMLDLGVDIYTVSKLLTHSNLATTQVYADVVDELKRDAAERISLKMPTKAESDQT